MLLYQGWTSPTAAPGRCTTRREPLRPASAHGRCSAQPKMIPWMHDPMILGPTVAAAANENLIQIKFNGSGLTLLDTAAVAKKRLIKATWLQTS